MAERQLGAAKDLSRHGVLRLQLGHRVAGAPQLGLPGLWAHDELLRDPVDLTLPVVAGGAVALDDAVELSAPAALEPARLHSLPLQVLDLDAADPKMRVRLLELLLERWSGAAPWMARCSARLSRSMSATFALTSSARSGSGATLRNVGEAVT